MPSRPTRSVGPRVWSEDGAVDQGARRAVRRRANASAVARSHWSTFAGTASSRGRTTSAAARSPAPSPSTRRTWPASVRSPGRADSTTTVAPSEPPTDRTGSCSATLAPSTTSRRCGARGPSGSRAARSSSELATMRRGPSASVDRVLRTCGSHFTQSHCEGSSASTATIRCSGAWPDVAAQTRDRAAARACSWLPQISTRSTALRSRAAGRSGCSRCATRSRCSADAQAGSGSSAAESSGPSSSTDSGWRRTPYLTCRKRGSPGLRPHSREPSAATAGSDDGSGWCHVSARRCSSAASRTAWRTPRR